MKFNTPIEIQLISPKKKREIEHFLSLNGIGVKKNMLHRFVMKGETNA